MLVVFLAVPALQRSQRNTSRRNDAARVASALSGFATNGTGSLPNATVAATWTTDCGTLLQEAGTLSQFNSVTCGSIGATVANDKFNATTGAVTSNAFSGVTNGHEGLLLDEAAQCSSSTSSTAGTSRQAALFYTQETGSAPVSACLNAQ